MTTEIDSRLEFEAQRAELWRQGEKIVKNSPQLMVEVDLESDGIAGFGSILAIGAQSPMGESFYREIRPDSEYFIPENRIFCETHNLERVRLITEAPSLGIVIPEFNDWVTELSERYEKPPVLSAFNAAFDWAHIDLAFIKSGLKNPFGIAPLDLKSLAILLSDDWDWKKTSKNSLPSIILPDGEFTHNALEDAQYQQKIHFGLAALLRYKFRY